MSIPLTKKTSQILTDGFIRQMHPVLEPQIIPSHINDICLEFYYVENVVYSELRDMFNEILQCNEAIKAMKAESEKQPLQNELETVDWLLELFDEANEQAQDDNITYNLEIIEELKNLNFGSNIDVMMAMDAVMDRNDINQITEYLISQQNRSNTIEQSIWTRVFKVAP
eukprot:375498_1